MLPLRNKILEKSVDLILTYVRNPNSVYLSYTVVTLFLLNKNISQNSFYSLIKINQTMNQSINA